MVQCGKDYAVQRLLRLKATLVLAIREMSVVVEESKVALSSFGKDYVLIVWQVYPLLQSHCPNWQKSQSIPLAVAVIVVVVVLALTLLHLMMMVVVGQLIDCDVAQVDLH